MPIKVAELNEATFKPFGKLLKVPDRKPDGVGEFHDYWDGLSLFSGETSVNYLITRGRALDFGEMERHQATAEILVLLEGACFLPVAPAGDLRDEAVRIFAMKPGDAVCMNPGTWHWLPFPLEKESRFLVVYKHGTPQTDLEFAKLGEKLLIED